MCVRVVSKVLCKYVDRRLASSKLWHQIPYFEWVLVKVVKVVKGVLGVVKCCHVPSLIPYVILQHYVSTNSGSIRSLGPIE